MDQKRVKSNRKCTFGPLVLFSTYINVSNCSFGPLSNCSNLHFWSDSSILKMDQKCKFVQFMNTLLNWHLWTTFKLFELDQKCRFKQFESGPKCNLTRDHEFRKEIQWTRSAFANSGFLQTLFWTTYLMRFIFIDKIEIFRSKNFPKRLLNLK